MAHSRDLPPQLVYVADVRDPSHVTTRQGQHACFVFLHDARRRTNTFFPVIKADLLFL